MFSLIKQSLVQVMDIALLKTLVPATSHTRAVPARLNSSALESWLLSQMYALARVHVLIKIPVSVSLAT